MTVPSGRARTVPVIRTTYSAAQVVRAVDHALDDAGVVAHVDEREVLAVLAAASDPAAHRHVLTDVVGAQLAAVVGAHRGRWPVTRRSVGFCGTWSIGRPGARPLLRRPCADTGRTVTVPGAARRSPTMSVTPRPNGRPASSGPAWSAGRRPGPPDTGASAARASTSAWRRPPTTSTTNTSTTDPPAQETHPRRHRRATFARCPEPNPMPGVGGPPSGSTSTVVAPAAADGVLRGAEGERRRTRTPCACSSRARVRARGSISKPTPTAVRPACTRSKCAAASSARSSIITWRAATIAGLLALEVEHPQRVHGQRLARRGLRSPPWSSRNFRSTSR